MSARFVGRGTETSELAGLLAEARAGRGAFVVVGGEPGIGRTAFARHVSETAEGVTVLWATCWADSEPYWPLVQLLRRLGTPDVGSLFAVDGFRLYDSVTQLLTTAGRPLLVVVDDVHLADQGTVRYLEFLAHQIRDSRIVVLVTSPDGHLPTQLARTGRRIRLTGLSEPETGELAGDDTGTTHQRTGGNPLLVTEVAQHPETDLPATVRELLGRRIAHLSPEVMVLLAVSAVVGARFDLREVAALTGRSVPEVRAALPFADGVVVDRDGFLAEFPYTLMRDVVLARLAEADLRQRVTRVVGADPTRSIVYFGRMLARVTDPGPRARLLVELAGAHRRAGDTTAAMAAARQATWLARDAGDHETAGWAALADGHQSPLGETDWTPVQAVEQALADIPGQDSELRARLLARLAVDTCDGEVAGQAVAMARRLDDPAVVTTTLLAFHDTLRWQPGTVHERLAVAGETVELATRAGFPETCAEGRLRQLEGLLELGRRAAAERVLTECALLVDQTRNPLWHRLYMAATARFRWLEKDFTAALAITREMADRSDQLPWVGPLWHEFAATLAIATGDTAGAAVAEARFAAAVAAAPPHWTRPMWQALGARLAARMGRPADARLTLDKLLAEGAPTVIGQRGGLACLACLAEVAYLVGADEYAAELLAALRPYAHVVVLYVWMPVSHYLGLLATMAGLAAEAADHRQSTVDIARRMGARLWLDQLDQLDQPDAPPPPAPTPEVAVLVREGDYWSLAHAGRTARLRHGKGLDFLAELLARPGAETPALQLAGAPPQGQGRDLGPHLDARAKSAYRERLADLRADLAEATGFHDLERARRARAEIDALARELARTVGLGGRDRPNGSAAERARVNVTRRLRSTITRIGQSHPDLGYHLDTAVRTGAYCSYQPGPAPVVTWRVNIVPRE